MKLICVTFLTIFALINGAPRSDGGDTANSIEDDLNDFMEVLPIEKIKKIAIQHLHDDLDFQAAIKYLQGPEWRDMVEKLLTEPELLKLVLFLKNAGLNLEIVAQGVSDFVMQAKVPDSDHKTRSLSKFINDVAGIIPTVALIDMFSNKIVNSPSFQEFYAKVSGEEAHQLVSQVRDLPSFKKIVEEIGKMDVDINRSLNVMYALLGWNKHQYSS